MNYYTADLHLGHKNIITLCDRLFNSVEEMDQTIIDNINNTVSAKDDLYILGDFSYKSGKSPIEYLKQINCKKHLIIGNHDSFMLTLPNIHRYFDSIDFYRILNDSGHEVVMFHYPLAEWAGFFRGSYHLYGHVHNNFTNPWHGYMPTLDHRFNVGVDVTDFKPVTLDQLIAK